MLHLKKYFTEGLIQVAILLSLSGVRVDLGLERYHHRLLGPTSALTQTHNLRSQVEHPKIMDLDEMLPPRRLLSLVRSLDRLQVPNSELDMWLVQREPDSFTGAHLDLLPPLDRTPVGLERDRAEPGMEPDTNEDIAENGDLPESLWPIRHADQSPIAIVHPSPDLPLSEHNHHGASLDEETEEASVDEEEEGRSRHTRGRDLQACNMRLVNNRQQVQIQADETPVSLQECLSLLEETFPATREPQLCDGVLGTSGGEDGPASLTLGSESLLSPLIPPGRPSLDLELQWQDLLAIMDPQEMGVDSMMGTTVGNMNHDDSFRLMQSRTLPISGSEVLGNSDFDSDSSPVIHQDVSLMEAALLQGSLHRLNQGQVPNMLPLTPSAQLYECNLDSIDQDPSRDVSYHMSLLAEDPSDTYSVGVENDTFSMNLLTPDPLDNYSCPPYAQSQSMLSSVYRRSPTSFGGRLHPFSSVPSPMPSLPNPSSLLPVGYEVEKEEAEDGVSKLLVDLLEDAAILDEISLLDLALEEGFSPEMAARLEEEGHLDPQRDTDTEEGDDSRSGSTMATGEEQGYPAHRQYCQMEADSDSGLSLDSSFSPASSCTSEASSYSSPISSSTSADGGESDMELEVTIKQEEQGEEEEVVLGAVGGSYSSDLKKFYSCSYQEPELFRLPWLENISHDHTYNQPCSSPYTPVTHGKTPTKPPKSSPRHHTPEPRHRHSPDRFTDSKTWNRDQRRACTMKIPFSNELIVNLPVEEFTELLAHHRLTEEQLNLVKDIRRRGKNKMAAQNCRRRKMDAIRGLGDDVSVLRRHRARLLREKQEALRSLKEMKGQLGRLYQEVFSSLRDDEGRLLDTTRYVLQFGTDGSVTVSSRGEGEAVSWTDGNEASRKHKDKKK